MRAFILVLICSVLIVSGQVLWKIAIDNNEGLLNDKYSIGQNIFNLISSYHMLVGILIYIIATIYWMYLLGEYEYSYIYPMLSITYVISILFAVMFFNEALTLFKVVGVFFIIFGVILIAKYG